MMIDSGFSSPRNDAFPAGLRVLVVDDDLTWLKILEKMLKKCSYEVTTCCLARDALNLLRERKDGYDIVISDVNMPDMDGFKLLEHVGLEMDLPVIMMSVDGETSRVMKGVQHGACDYLLKPIRMKELRNIWQHVFRKKIHEVRDIESFEAIESIQMTRSGSDQTDDMHFLGGEDPISVKKRKDHEHKHDDSEFGDPSATKKARVVWSVDLHQKFVKAVNQIGFDKVGPKKILDLMNVPWLTRENVASHLQKYRLYLSRLQKENDLKASFGGLKHSDSPSKDPPGSFGFQNSTNILHSDVSNGSYGFPGNSSLVHSSDPKCHEGDRKAILSVPVKEPKRLLTVDIPDPHMTRISQMGFDHTFASLNSDADLRAFDTNSSAQYSWSEASRVQFKQEPKPLQLDGFDPLPLPPLQHEIQAEFAQPERDVAGPIKVKSSYDDDISGHGNHVSSRASANDLLPVHIKGDTVQNQPFELISCTTTTSSLKSQAVDLSCITPNLQSAQRTLTWGIESPFGSLNDDLQVSWLQGNCLDLGLQNLECTGYNDLGLIAGVPINLYDALSFDYEHLCDLAEYSIIDQGLFIA